MSSILSSLASPKILLALGLLALAALALLAWFLHRRRVKQTSPGDSAGETAPRRRRLGGLLPVLVLALCLFLLLADCLLWLRLGALQSSMSSGLTGISKNIDLSRQILYREIRAQGSLFSDYQWKVLRADLPAGRLEVRFSAAPKAASQTTRLSLRIDEEEVPLERDQEEEGVFTGVFTVDPFDSLKYDALLSLNDGGYIRTEKLELSLEDWREEFFPSVTVKIHDSAQEWEKGGWGDTVHASLKGLLTAEAGSLRSITMLVRQKDKILEEISLDEKLSDDYHLWYRFDLSGDYALGEVTEYQILYTDLHRYVHLRTFLVLRPDGTLGEGYPERVYDEAGNLLGRLEWEDPNQEPEDEETQSASQSQD